MALKIVTGGTTGAADGTLVSSGNPLVIAALNTAIDAHIRCDDGYWSNDQSFDVPAELEVSFNGGSTWYDNADEPITAPEIYAVNVPIKIRQTTAAASSSGSFTTDGTYTAITALGQVTGGSVTRTSTTQSDLSWSALSNRTYYKIERATDSGFTANLTTLSSTATATTYSDTTCAADTTYYYRVRGLGTGRYSDGTVSATLTSSHKIQAYYESVLTGIATPRHYWKLTETSGTAFTDSGSNAITINGTSISAAGTTGPDGVAKAVLHPGGSGKYLASASALQLNGITTWTWIFWFKAVSWPASGTTAKVAELIDAGASTSYFLVGKDVYGTADTFGIAALMDSVTTSANYSTTKPASGSWHMFAAVFDSALSGTAKLKTYMDGSAQGTATNVGTPGGNLTNNCKLSLLARGVPFGTAGSSALDGAVSNVAFIPSALTSGNISSLYSALA